MQKWSVVKEKRIKIKPSTYVLFMFKLDDECKIIKNKQFVIKNMFLAATLVGWTEGKFGLFTYSNQILQNFVNFIKIHLQLNS